MSGMMIFKYLLFLGIKCREPVQVAQIGAVLLPVLNRMEHGVKLWRSSAFDQMCHKAPESRIGLFLSSSMASPTCRMRSPMAGSVISSRVSLLQCVKAQKTKLSSYVDADVGSSKSWMSFSMTMLADCLG